MVALTCISHLDYVATMLLADFVNGPELAGRLKTKERGNNRTVTRHAMCPSQLFTWRRELRKQMEAQGLALPVTSPIAPLFVPAVVEPAMPSGVGPVGKRPRRGRRSSPGAVELEIDGVAVKIGRGADKGLIAAVIEALKATR